MLNAAGLQDNWSLIPLSPSVARGLQNSRLPLNDHLARLFCRVSHFMVHSWSPFAPISIKHIWNSIIRADFIIGVMCDCNKYNKRTEPYAGKRNVSVLEYYRSLMEHMFKEKLGRNVKLLLNLLPWKKIKIREKSQLVMTRHENNFTIYLLNNQSLIAKVDYR